MKPSRDAETDTKGNIITVYAIQRHIEQSEIGDVHWNNVDAVPAPCGVTAPGEFMDRADYLGEGQ